MRTQTKLSEYDDNKNVYPTFAHAIYQAPAHPGPCPTMADFDTDLIIQKLWYRIMLCIYSIAMLVALGMYMDAVPRVAPSGN